MKTLFISDLDGTLLTPEARISNRTREIINELSDEGAYISVATARTPATAWKLLEGIRLRGPAVMMNGASMFDAETKQMLHEETMAEESVRAILSEIKGCGLGCFSYHFENGKQYTSYEKVVGPHMESFMKERMRDFAKQFTQTPSLELLADKGIQQISMRYPKAVLEPVFHATKGLRGVHAEFYRDVYDDGVYYLEYYSSAASKRHGVDMARAIGGFERVIGFGDNTNDIPMFQACDESYAVANAKDEIKAAARDVIGANTEDGVAVKLRELWSDIINKSH